MDIHNSFFDINNWIMDSIMDIHDFIYGYP